MLRDPPQRDDLRLRALADNAPDIIARFDRGLRLLYVNRAIERATGQAVADLLGATPEKLGMPPAQTDLLRGALEHVFVTGAEHDIEFDVDTSAGTRSFQTRIVPERGESGRIETVVAASRDITDTRAVRLLNAALRHVPAGISVVEAPSGKVQFISAETERIFRKPAVLLDNVDEYRYYSGLHADGREISPHEWPLARSITTGEVVHGEELEIIRGDTTRGVVRVSSAPIPDRSGRITGGVVTFYDITEQRRAEQALRESQAALAKANRELERQVEAQRFLADASALLAGSLDSAAILSRLTELAVPAIADGCTVHGLDPDGSVRLLASEHRDPRKAALGRAMGQRYPLQASRRSAIYRVLCGGPSELAGEITDAMLDDVIQSPQHREDMRAIGYRSAMIVPLAGRGGVFAAMTFFATQESDRRYTRADMHLAEDLARRAALAVESAHLYEEMASVATENERMYREAQEADHRKDEFLAMLAHELRNPLAPMLTGLKVIRLRADTASFEKPLATIERQVRHMTRLVDDLLDVSRITRGTIELRREPLELSALLARAVETTRPLVESRQHSLRVTPARAWVNADPVRLEQVLANLLQNAAKYTEPGGQIEVACALDGAEVLIRVVDSGVGIPPDVLPHVFEPFMQAKRSLDRSQGGLGIGLTLVKRLVEMHGGRVEARSEGPGRGSEFVVRLPWIEEPPAGA